MWDESNHRRYDNRCYARDSGYTGGERDRLDRDQRRSNAETPLERAGQRRRIQRKFNVGEGDFEFGWRCDGCGPGSGLLKEYGIELPRLRNRAGSCPAFRFNGMAKGESLTAHHGESADTVLPYVAASGPAASKLTNSLVSRAWEELDEKLLRGNHNHNGPGTENPTAEALTLNTGGGSASPEFVAYLQQAFEAEQGYEEKGIGNITGLDKYDFVSHLPETTHVRERAKAFLKELLESPPPDLKDLWKAFTTSGENSVQLEKCSVREEVSRSEGPMVS